MAVIKDLYWPGDATWFAYEVHCKGSIDAFVACLLARDPAMLEAVAAYRTKESKVSLESLGSTIEFDPTKPRPRMTFPNIKTRLPCKMAADGGKP